MSAFLFLDFLPCYFFKKYHVQVDLGIPTLVVSIATQGRRFTLYVKTYKLGYSDDGKTWTMYEESGNVKVMIRVPLLAAVLFSKGHLDEFLAIANPKGRYGRVENEERPCLVPFPFMLKTSIWH